MSGQFILVKSHKSVGIAILLTILFGPIGLFYASITGGIIMTCSPLIVFILTAFGLVPIMTFLTFTVLYICLYWLINILWAIAAVNQYNSRIDRDYQRQQILTSLPPPRTFTISQKKTTDPSTTTNLTDWLRANPGKSINDYFAKFK